MLHQQVRFLHSNATCSPSVAIRKSRPKARCIRFFLMLVELAYSVAGRGHLSNIPGNFLPLMSYWVWPWVTIVIEKHLPSHNLRGLISDWTA